MREGCHLVFESLGFGGGISVFLVPMRKGLVVYVGIVINFCFVLA